MNTSILESAMDEQPKVLTAEEQLRNVANTMLRYAEIKRVWNGKGRSSTYAGNADTLAQTGKQLAEMVLEYLRGELKDTVIEDDLPF